MLGSEQQHGTVEHQHVVQAAFFGAFPFVVDDAGRGEVVVPPASLDQTPAQVDVLTVHEELLVQQTHIVQGLLPHPHEGPRKDVDFCGLVFCDMPGVISIPLGRPRGQMMQPCHPTKRCPWSGHPALGLRQKLTSPVVHGHPHAPHFRVRLHVRKALHKRVLTDHRVGVQQQDMVPFGLPNGLVVRHGKSNIVAVGHEVHFGKAGPHHFHRSIHTVVVHHPDFQVQTRRCALHRHQALLQECPNIVADNDDTEVHQPLYGRRFNNELDNVASSAYCRASPTETPLAKVVSMHSLSTSLLAK